MINMRCEIIKQLSVHHLICSGVEANGVVVQEEVDEEGRRERYCQHLNAGKLNIFSVPLSVG